MSIKNEHHFSYYLANIQVDITNCNRIALGKEWVFNQIQHEFNMLYYMVSGQCQITANDISFIPQAGDLIMLPAKTVITTSATNECAFIKYYCHFTATIGGVPLFDLIEVPYRISMSDHQTFHTQFQSLVQTFSNRTLTATLRAKAILLQLICTYIDSSPTLIFHENDNKEMQNISRVLEYIENNLPKKLTVNQLAKQVHYHPRYFIQVFKSMVGLSPMQYIAKLRYERACMLLTYTPLNHHEIAERIGILPDYFTKFFKHHSGFSPTDYRQRTTQTP